MPPTGSLGADSAPQSLSATTGRPPSHNGQSKTCPTSANPLFSESAEGVIGRRRGPRSRVSPARGLGAGTLLSLVLSVAPGTALPSWIWEHPDQSRRSAARDSREFFAPPCRALGLAPDIVALTCRTLGAYEDFPLASLQPSTALVFRIFTNQGGNTAPKQRRSTKWRSTTYPSD